MRYPLLQAVAACCLICGCTAVNPTADYARTAAHVARATGHKDVFNPDDAQAVRERVSALLEGGLTGDEAVQAALLNNAELQAAFFDVGMARADVVQAGLLSNPSLGMALRLPAAGGLANIDFELAQNIADLWQIPVRKRAAERNLEQTILTIARQAVETAALAKSAYYAAVGAELRLQIARENLEVSRQVLELTEVRRQIGAGSDLDVNLARGVMLNAELAVTQARLAAASARRSLAAILGLAVDAHKLELADALPQPPSYAFDAERLVDTAWVERLDVQALRQSIRSAEERLILEYRRVFPSLEFGLAFERESRGRAQGRDILADTARSSIAAGRLSAPQIEPRSARKVHTDFVVGPLLSLELPIFDQNQAQIARARFELEQRLRLLEGLERTIRQEVREAVDQARTAWEVARFYQTQVVPQADESLELSRESYKAGKSSILSVLDAQRTYLTARDRYAAALQRAAAAVPLLEQTVGLPIGRLLDEPNRRRPTTAPAMRPSDRDDSDMIDGR